MKNDESPDKKSATSTKEKEVLDNVEIKKLSHGFGTIVSVTLAIAPSVASAKFSFGCGGVYT